MSLVDTSRPFPRRGPRHLPIANAPASRICTPALAARQISAPAFGPKARRPVAHGHWQPVRPGMPMSRSSSPSLQIQAGLTGKQGHHPAFIHPTPGSTASQARHAGLIRRHLANRAPIDWPSRAHRTRPAATPEHPGIRRPRQPAGAEVNRQDHRDEALAGHGPDQGDQPCCSGYGS